MAKKIQLEITAAQFDMLNSILYRVQDCMTWDEDMQRYTDADGFVMSCNKREYNTLKRIDLYNSITKYKK